MQSEVRFNEKVPEKVWEALSGEGLGGFGAEPGQVQQGSDADTRSYLGGDVLVVSGRLRWWFLVVCLWCFPARHENLIPSAFSGLVAPCTR